MLFFTTFMASSTMSSSKSSLSFILELLLLLLIPTHLSTLSFPFYALLFTVDAWENNAINENIADGQSPPSSEVAVLDIEMIIQRAVQEEEKKEIVKNESHFLDYIKTKKDTPSKNYWTKDKSGFFESVLACEANVNEDELVNLIDSGPEDAVLYGKTVQPSRSEGNNEKKK